MNIITFEPKQNMNKTIRDREEKHIYKGYKAICIDGGKIQTLVDVRIGATNGAHYACIWLDGSEWAYGSGKASGYGYDRASAAVERAFHAAGIKFDKAFGGCGSTMTEEAIKAAGEYLSNGKTVYIVDFYG